VLSRFENARAGDPTAYPRRLDPFNRGFQTIQFQVVERDARRTHGERCLQLLGGTHEHVHLRRGRKRHRWLQLRQGISDNAICWRGLVGGLQGHELFHHLTPQGIDLTDRDE
jgi:hypothetical protein